MYGGASVALYGVGHRQGAVDDHDRFDYMPGSA